MFGFSKYQKALSDLSKETLIRMDRKNHGKRPYAPAWKALGFMSFGNNCQDIQKSEKPSLAMRDFCSLWHEPPFSVFQLYQYGKETE